MTKKKQLRNNSFLLIVAPFFRNTPAYTQREKDCERDKDGE